MCWQYDLKISFKTATAYTGRLSNRTIMYECETGNEEFHYWGRLTTPFINSNKLLMIFTWKRGLYNIKSLKLNLPTITTGFISNKNTVKKFRLIVKKRQLLISNCYI